MQGIKAKLGKELRKQGKAPGFEYRRAHQGEKSEGEEATEGKKGWWEDSWPWMQTDRQGNQRQAVTFSAAGGSKALFKGLVNAGYC